MPAAQQNNDQEHLTFEELYDRHFNAVNRYLRYRVPVTWDADDLTAAVFIKAMEKYHHFRGEAPVAVWLFRICHNTYVDYMRSRRKTVDLSDTAAAPGIYGQPEEEYLQREQLVLLKKYLQRLPLDYRDVLSLRYMGELKFRQIAQVLGKKEASVRMAHYRALKMLRIFMAGDGGSSGE
jgi:RNA polymerase sigma-70 factor (ECF subfamily)